MLKVIEQDYLKNGKKFIEWEYHLALFVFYDGYMYQDLAQLFDAFEDETKSLSKEKRYIIKKVEGWNYGEIICSVLTTLLNERTFTISNWVTLYSYLLFSDSLETSQIVFSFLQKNYFFVFCKNEKFTLYSAGLESLIGCSMFNVDEIKLTNFLTLLRVSHHEKIELISKCLESNSYLPLNSFIQKVLYKNKRKSL